MQPHSALRSHFTAPWRLPLDIGAWYGNPVSEAGASSWLAEIRDSRRAGDQATLLLDLADLAALFWCGRLITSRVEVACNRADAPLDRSLIEIVYGQLLASRRLSGAHHWLQRGFERAAPYLDATTYLQLLRRHERLAALPLSPVAGRPTTLGDLLVEADVVRQLRGRQAGTCVRANGHLDTIG